MLEGQTRLNEPRKKAHHRFLPRTKAGTDAPPSWALEIVATAAVFGGFLGLLLLKAPGLDYFLTSRDHGYQLAIGGQALLGKVPGLDIVTVYGPMAMLTSALGLRLSGSLLGETLLCAGGYALCFTLLYALTRREWSRWAGLASAIVGYVLMARFYKWYVWLIPLATLWALQGWLYASEAFKRRWLAAGGLIVGLGWLYRLDMGTFAGAAVVAMIAFVECRQDRRTLLRSLATFLTSAACFPIAWLVYLAGVGGISAPWRFLASSFHGALVVSRGMAAPMPPLLSIAVGYASATAVLAVALVVGLALSWRRPTPRTLFLLASALVGLAVVHQAMHRRDPAHLLQVAPPVIVAAFAILGLLKTAALDSNRRAAVRVSAAACGMLAAGGLAYATNGLRPFSQWDLVPIGSNPGARLSRLVRPLGLDDHPAVGVIKHLREQTAPTDAVLVFPLDSQILTLAERPMSGRLHGYYAGVFDAPDDAEANLAAIQADPPAVVVVPSPKGPTNGSDWPSDDLARRGISAHAYLDRYIRANYTRIVYDDGRSAVLAR